MSDPIEWLDLGLVGYHEAFAVQEMLHDRRRNSQGHDILLFQENFPTITIGKSGSEEHVLADHHKLAAQGINVVYVSRGGDVTYHGPGQLVISPILQLKNRVQGVHQYVRFIEQVVINLVAKYGILGQRIEGASGVWVSDKKVAALGIAVRNGITQHGVAINVAPNLSHFNMIIPCGIKDKGVTSLQELDVCVTDLQQVRDDFISEFSNVFQVKVTKGDINEGVKYK
jgi:lipoyl(octanoyl) transferase